MPAVLLVLLLAASVKDGLTPLRSGCSPDARVLASLPAGAPVTIKYSINGETGPCYKVSVEVDGKILEGSLPASSIGETEDFDQARRVRDELDRACEVRDERIRAGRRLGKR